MGWDEIPPPEWQEIAEALSVRLSEVEMERDALRAELARVRPAAKRDAAARVLLRHHYGPDWRQRVDEILAAALSPESEEEVP